MASDNAEAKSARTARKRSSRELDPLVPCSVVCVLWFGNPYVYDYSYRSRSGAS